MSTFGRRSSHSQSSEKELWTRLAGPLAADDPQVLHILKQHFLSPPSTLPYNFSMSIKHRDYHNFSWPWIHAYLEKLFGKERGGFFVEAGALDGEYLSNTMWLEKNLGWTGLLVEPNTDSYKMLVTKHRRAWTSNTCLSAEGYPKRTILVSRTLSKDMVFGEYWWAFRGQTHEMGVDYPGQETLRVLTDSSYSKVQCFPLLSYLLAINITTVDLFSLDVQGSEMDILRTFLTSSQILIRVIVVEDETNNFDHAFMASHGYVLIDSLNDHLYVKKDDPALRGLNVAVTTNATVK